MCKPSTCGACNKSTWWGCGQHISMVMDSIPEADRCTCSPQVEFNGQTYPPKAGDSSELKGKADGGYCAVM